MYLLNDKIQVFKTISLLNALIKLKISKFKINKIKKNLINVFT